MGGQAFFRNIGEVRLEDPLEYTSIDDIKTVGHMNLMDTPVGEDQNPVNYQEVKTVGTINTGDFPHRPDPLFYQSVQKL